MKLFEVNATFWKYVVEKKKTVFHSRLLQLSTFNYAMQRW